MTTLRILRLEVIPSPDTRDHEVRLVVDDEDLIARRWPDMIGLDPDDLLISPSPLRAGGGHEATIARCDCGVIGCGRQEVRIVAQGDRVLWHFFQGDALAFAAGAYLEEIERAERDTSWETPDRTAARLVRERVDRPALARHGLRFDWSSGRLANGGFTVSLTLQPGSYQILVAFPWSEDAPDALAARVLALLARPPASWPDVTYAPMQGGASVPPLAGPGWRRA